MDHKKYWKHIERRGVPGSRLPFLPEEPEGVLDSPLLSKGNLFKWSELLYFYVPYLGVGVRGHYTSIGVCSSCDWPRIGACHSRFAKLSHPWGKGGLPELADTPRTSISSVMSAVNEARSAVERAF
ncbi:hypothetical protein CDAR_100521 [Caerostris darwini]|uniref:Uncharacterized protein n=1 Tax=Caerostris darwini TaxID=1538125 RepID=A0AAV4X5M9_9ARAC|nr:hypothetical protein CDAR_100521 [Caerostris darwini]